MATNGLLTTTHCTHTEIFLKEAEIIFTEMNVTFDDDIEEMRFDLKDALDKLGINEDWESRNQVTIDQRKKQLEQCLLPIRKCICEYNKPGRVLHECSWD